MLVLLHGAQHRESICTDRHKTLSTSVWIKEGMISSPTRDTGAGACDGQGRENMVEKLRNLPVLNGGWVSLCRIGSSWLGVREGLLLSNRVSSMGFRILVDGFLMQPAPQSEGYIMTISQ
jgi:hypothetical protein